MLFMVIERYTSGPGPVYERAARLGRMLPDGLHYVDSWIDADPPMDRCFQLMETDDPALFQVWLDRWRDLVTLEVVPVITSADAADRVGERWSGAADRVGERWSGAADRVGERRSGAADPGRT